MIAWSHGVMPVKALWSTAALLGSDRICSVCLSRAHLELARASVVPSSAFI